MTTVVITHEGGFITGFTATGHTGYAEEGEDIVSTYTAKKKSSSSSSGSRRGGPMF